MTVKKASTLMDSTCTFLDKLVGFDRAREPVLYAPRTHLFGSINTPNEALRAYPPPPIAASLLLIHPPK